MTITAIFSNGYADTYKGNRDVKAAWAIINKETGKVIKSGHSLDVAKAHKTADGKLHEVWFERDFGISGHPLNYFKGANYTDNSKARREKRLHNAARLDFIRSKITIEVVSI